MSVAKQKARQKFVRPYRTQFTRALDLQLQPVLEAIEQSFNVLEVPDKVNELMKPDALEDVYYELYPEVGTTAALINVDQINAQLRQKNYKQKDEVEDLWMQYLLRYIETVGTERIVSVTATSRELALQAIQKAIDEALEEGLSPYEAQKEIEKTVRQEWRRTNVFRADRIARTEVYTAYSLADYQSAESYQIPLRKVWVHGFVGKDDRRGHIAMDGTAILKNEVFVDPMTGDRLNHPHDWNAPAGAVINCKCSLTWERV